ncbi:unnamed protein product [Tuber melanosporum]|uniref:(Perigord truffle) hypothetical protein n=1 Tax=Tuber melanosporum (strain Mel28) TaxID=656061 RepID=D5GBH1_TUBMM|nr:uncharacterized protein GSTUM_00000497001 [Tuber melanosporum]CAZ81864.1 unnamed protein product [Tuber melanosporum]
MNPEPVHNRRLSVEDAEDDEVLPSYEDVIQGGSSATIVAALPARLRYRTPSPRPGSRSQQRISLPDPSTAPSSASPQQYSSLLGPSFAPTIVASPSLATVTPPHSRPIGNGNSPQELRASRSPQPKYSSLLPPASGPTGPPPNYNVTTSSLPEPPRSREGKERDKAPRTQRWMFGKKASQAYHEGHLEKKYAPSKYEGVPLEYVVDRFGNRKRELKFEMDIGVSITGLVRVGVKSSRFGG